MTEQTYVFEPWVCPMVRHGSTDYVVDLKRGHFRQLSSPFEVIEFESDRGQEMCAAVGVITCSCCKISVMFHAAPFGLYCIRCGTAIGVDDRQTDMVRREKAVAVVTV